MMCTCKCYCVCIKQFTLHLKIRIKLLSPVSDKTEKNLESCSLMFWYLTGHQQLIKERDWSINKWEMVTLTDQQHQLKKSKIKIKIKNWLYK